MRDPVLRRTIGFTVVQIHPLQLKRARIASAGKRKGVRLSIVPSLFDEFIVRAANRSTHRMVRPRYF